MKNLDPIRKLLSAASSRLAMSRALDGVAWGCVAAAAVLSLVVIASKFVPDFVVPWGALAIGLGVAVLATAIVFSRIAAASERSIALLVDERLGLDERFISAIALEDSQDPFARAAVADALQLAADPALTRKIRKAFPLAMQHRGWYALLAIALLLGLDALLPVYAWKSPDAALVEPAALQLAQDTSRAAVEKVIQEVEDRDELKKELERNFGDLAKVGEAGKELANPTSPEEARRDAIRRMSDLAEKIDAVRTGEKAQLSQALKQDLKSLDATEQSQGKELADALAKGDFSEAKKQLDDLAKKAADGSMSDAEKAKLEQDLSKLSKQLDALADRQQALQDALSKAGLDPQLAKNPAALAEAVKNSDNLSQQQKAALEKQIASSSAAQQVLKQLAQNSQKAASQCKNPGDKPGQQGQQGQQGQKGQQGQQGAQGESGESGEMGSGMSEQLSELEQTQEMLQQAEGAANACESACQSQGEGLGSSKSSKESNSNNTSVMGPDELRQGGRGRASGGKTPTAKTPSGTKSIKERTKTTKGDIIARQLVENPNPEVGVSGTALENIAGEIADAAEGAVDEVEVPAHLREAHKKYFGRMKKELDAKGVTAPVAPAPSAPGSSETPKP